MNGMELEERARIAESLAFREGFFETARAFGEIRKELSRSKPKHDECALEPVRSPEILMRAED